LGDWQAGQRASRGAPHPPQNRAAAGFSRAQPAQITKV
jgi:hypothetical protein